MKATIAAFCVILGCASASAPSHAKDKDRPAWRSWPAGDRVSVFVGAFSAALSTKITLDSTDGELGTELDLESDLGLADGKLTPIASIKWRMAKNHRLAFNYFRLDRDGAESSDVTIRIGDAVLAANLPIQTTLNVEVLEADYAYSVFFRERHNLAIGIGLSVQNLDFSVVGRGEIEEIDLEESADVPAPLPTLVLSYNFAILKKLLLDVNIGWLALSIDSGSEGDDSFWDFDGSIWNNSIALNYKPFKHVGFKFAYLSFDLDLEVEDNDRNLTLDYVYRGPSIGVEAFF